MSSSGWAQMPRIVPRRGTALIEPRCYRGHASRAAGGSSGGRLVEPTDQVPDLRGERVGGGLLRALLGDHHLQVAPELRPLHARVAVGEVLLDPDRDDAIELAVEEPLDLPQG